MNHFHLMIVRHTYPVYVLRFDNYEDSLQTYVKFSTMFFSHLVSSSALAIEKARAATGGGTGEGAIVGPPNCAIMWMRCDMNPCMSGTWN